MQYGLKLIHEDPYTGKSAAAAAALLNLGLEDLRLKLHVLRPTGANVIYSTC